MVGLQHLCYVHCAKINREMMTTNDNRNTNKIKDEPTNTPIRIE